MRSDIREAVEAQLHEIRTGDEPLTSVQLVGRASGAPSAPCEVRATATIGKRKLVVVRRGDSETRALTMAVAALMATTAHMVERPSSGRDAGRGEASGREPVQPVLIGLASSQEEKPAAAWLQRGSGASIVGEAGQSRIGARLESVLGTVSATGGRAMATIGSARSLDLWRGEAAPDENFQPAPRRSREPIPLPFGLEEAPSRWNAGRVAGLTTAAVLVGLLATSGWWSGVQLRAQPLREALAYLPSLPSFGAEATASSGTPGSETGPLASAFSAVAGGPDSPAASFAASSDDGRGLPDVAAGASSDPLDDPFYWAIASAP